MKTLLLTEKILALLIIGFATIFIWLTLATHAGLKTQTDDLGNMAQAIWNTGQGRVMEYSNVESTEPWYHNRLGGHANFIFLFLVPLYTLWSDPRVLLVVQVFMVSLAGIPIFWLGRQLFGPRSTLSLLGPFLFYINPMLHDAVLYDIHAIVLGLPFLTLALYSLLTKKNRLFLVAAILLILCKEDMPLLVLMMGLYAVFAQRRKRWGLCVMALSLGYFILLIEVLMPSFRINPAASLISTRYADLGGSPVGIVKMALTQPRAIFDVLNQNQAATYIGLHLLAFGGVPSVSWLSLVAAPTVAINLLSANPITSIPFGYYYGAPIVGVGAVVSLVALHQRQQLWPRLGITVSQTGGIIALVALIFSWWYSPVPGSRVSRLIEFQVDDHDRTLAEIKRLIPPEASLTVQNNLGPHFINRRTLVRFPYRAHLSDYILIDMTDPYPIIRDQPRQRNFVHITQLFPQDYYDTVMGVFALDNYGVRYAGDGYFLFQRDHPQDLNRVAYQAFRDRARVEFAHYQTVAPVNYWELESYQQ